MASTTPKNKKRKNSATSISVILVDKPVQSSVNFLGILMGHAGSWLYGFFEAWKLDSTGRPSA